jgi:hypothetical protein
MSKQLLVTSGTAVITGGDTPYPLPDGLRPGLAGIVARELGPDAAVTLAEPEEGRPGITDWYTSLDGAPLELSGLPEAKRLAAEKVLRGRAGEYAALGARLASGEDKDLRPYGKLLLKVSAELAGAVAGVPGQGKVFVIEGVPVFCMWGMPRQNEPKEPAPAEPEVLPAVPLAYPQAVQAPPAYAMPAAYAGSGYYGRDDSRKAALLSVIAALGVFLIVLVLFGALSPGFRKAAGAVTAKPLELPRDTGLEDDLRSELAALKRHYHDTLMACRPDDPEPGLEDAPLALPDPNLESLQPPPSSGDAPTALESAPPPPPPPPPTPEPEPEPEPGPDPKPKPKPKPKPAEGTQRRGGSLKIPDNPKDLSFLKGCWRADAGIYDRFGNSVSYNYCFSANGGASVRVDVRGSSGRGSTTCNTTGRASLSGGGVTIQDGGAKCANGVRFNPARVICRPGKGGAASCAIVNSDGSQLTTRFIYQGG